MAKAAVIKQAGTDRMVTAKEQAEKKASQSILRKSVFTKLSDILAESNFYQRNHPIPGAVKAFVDWKMHYVDLYYPHAKLREGTIAPLFIDFPRSDLEVETCKKKKEFMREQKLRYTYIALGFGEQEAREILES